MFFQRSSFLIVPYLLPLNFQYCLGNRQQLDVQSKLSFNVFSNPKMLAISFPCFQAYKMVFNVAWNMKVRCSFSYWNAFCFELVEFQNLFPWTWVLLVSWLMVRSQHSALSKVLMKHIPFVQDTKYESWVDWILVFRTNARKPGKNFQSKSKEIVMLFF